MRDNDIKCGDRSRRGHSYRGRVIAASAGSVVAAAAALAFGQGPASAVQATVSAVQETAKAGADARSGERANRVRLSYGSPRRTGRSGDVTWSWTVTNSGGKSARNIVVTHDVSGGDVGRVPGACKVRPGTVVCRIGSLDPGDSVANSMELEIPGDDRAFLRGHVEWEDGGTTVTKSASIRPAAPRPKTEPGSKVKPGSKPEVEPQVQQNPKDKPEPAPRPAAQQPAPPAVQQATRPAPQPA